MRSVAEELETAKRVVASAVRMASAFLFTSTGENSASDCSQLPNKPQTIERTRTHQVFGVSSKRKATLERQMLYPNKPHAKNPSCFTMEIRS